MDWDTPPEDLRFNIQGRVLSKLVRKVIITMSTIRMHRGSTDVSTNAVSIFREVDEQKVKYSEDENIMRDSLDTLYTYAEAGAQKKVVSDNYCPRRRSNGFINHLEKLRYARLIFSLWE